MLSCERLEPNGGSKRGETLNEKASSKARRGARRRGARRAVDADHFGCCGNAAHLGRRDRKASVEKVANAWGKKAGVTVTVVQKDFGKIRDDLKTVDLATAPDVIVGAHDWVGELARTVRSSR